MTNARVGKSKIGLDLTEGSIAKLLIIFALPMIMTNLIQQLYSTVDLIIIGKNMGPVGTVGVSTGGELSDIMTPIATAFATAGQIYIAQLMGAREKDRVKETIGTLVSLMMLISVVIMIAVIVFNAGILRLLNCPEDAFTQAQAYMIITAVGMPFIFGYNAICGILRGMGESKRPLIFIIVAAVINVVLDILLVAVFHLEAAGTAIATVISQFGSFTASFLYMYKRKEHFGFQLKVSYFRIRWDVCKIILKLGIPQLIRVSLVRFSMLWINANINSYGLIVSATNSVGNKINKFLEVFTQGVDSAAGAMIGQNLGARKTDRTKKIVWTSLVYSLILGGICILLVLLLPTKLYAFFTDDPEVIEFGITYLRILAVAIFVTSVIGPFNAVITGSGFVSLGFAIGILDGMICRIGFSLIYVNVLQLGPLSYFWGTATCRILPCILCMWYFFSGRWETRKLLTVK